MRSNVGRDMPFYRACSSDASMSRMHVIIVDGEVFMAWAPRWKGSLRSSPLIAGDVRWRRGRGC